MAKTSLTDEDYSRCLAAVQEYLSTHPFVNNAILREVTGLESDQGIRFFKRVTESGVLIREGKSQATRYRRP